MGAKSKSDPAAPQLAAPESQASRLVDHMLPPGARDERFARHFSHGEQTLLRCTYELNDKQIQRLTVALRVIAYYTQAAPALSDVRKPLDALAKSARKTAQGLEALLLAPAHEDARIEARDCIGHAVFALYPERCQPDPTKFSAFHEHDERLEGVMRAAREVEAVANRALAGVPSSATKAPAHPYPIACIHAALEAREDAKGGKALFTPSASSTSPFREIVRICYEAAGAPITDPERAIRAYLKGLKDSDNSS